MKNYKKQYQILAWLLLLLLTASIVCVIYLGLEFIIVAIPFAVLLGGVITRLFFNTLIEFGKKYLETADLQKELKR